MTGVNPLMSRPCKSCLPGARSRHRICPRSVNYRRTTTMIIDLAGKHTIVTGSTSGIGFAIARGLAESGAAVVINGRSQKSVDAALLRLGQQLPQANIEGIAADLATATGAAAFVERASRTDILV